MAHYIRLFCKRIINIIVSISMILAIAFIAYWFLQITMACSFHTPSGSMQPTLLPDESGLVNKCKMGARIFNLKAAIDGRPFEIYRLPGYGCLERGDVIVFNYPYLDSDRHRDSIAMNLHTYYCKRAVATAGDTLEIRDCFYHVRGCADTLGVASEQEALRRYVDDFAKSNPESTEWPGWMKCNPRDSVIEWTIRDMGPIVIPKKGTQIKLDYRNWLLYRRYIEWETGKKLVWQNSMAKMDDKQIKMYKFVENYCFAAGDHVIDSKDSRYFGLVPEKFIVGTAGILWRSRDKDRRFTLINKH